ncbi:MAG: GGDEF domain-containing protein [Eubacteriaceae bacterium]|jgi:diguanylate cyclase (GGDEF)-like protein|nr:GGDEF domain-containing protein [Eubacteriaceae bacterium]
MYEAVAIELNTICILILLFIIFKLRGSDNSTEVICFLRVLISVLVVLFIDMLWVMIESSGRTSLIPLNNIINVIYMADTGVIGYFWLRFIEYKLGKWKYFSRRARLLLLLPMLILALFSITAPFNDLLFYVDSLNVYHRGDWYPLQLVVSYGYLGAASFHIASELRFVKTTSQRNALLFLLSFLFFPVIGGLISVIFYGLPVVWPASTLSLLLLYMDMQDRRISTDSLTNLNNRRKFDQYLEDSLEHTRNISLLIMDINNFKHINDTCGHLAGDKALQETAEILKSVCGAYNAFLSRYGGDEFAVVLMGRRTDAEQLKQDINDALAARNRGKASAFEINLSIGIAARAAGSTSKSLIDTADRELYKEKARSRTTLFR